MLRGLLPDLPVGLTGGETVVCTALAAPASCTAPSSRGLGRRPLKAVTPVRIRSGLLVLPRPRTFTRSGVFALVRAGTRPAPGQVSMFGSRHIGIPPEADPAMTRAGPLQAWR